MMDNQAIVNQFSSYLFWDTDSKTLDMEQHQAYIVSRVLDYGMEKDYQVMQNYYGKERLKDIASGIRSMFPESLTYISTLTNTPKNQFRCYKQLQSKDQLWYF
jgi:hypothetical protein